MRYVKLILVACYALVSFNFIGKSYSVIPAWNEGIEVVLRNLAHEPVKKVGATDLIEFAKTFIGTKYVWGSVNPKVGFDCSGFVNHVAKNFDFEVPRTSVQYTNLGEEVDPADAQSGDIILFTGSNPKKRVVGHMGIITENIGGELQFIHSSSGGSKGVHISEMTPYYTQRLVKVIRLFPLENGEAVG